MFSQCNSLRFFERGLSTFNVGGRIRVLFEAHLERLQVARLLRWNGLSINGDNIYLNEVEIPTLKLAGAVRVDRRTVNETIRAMSIDREIKVIFSKLESCGPSLRAAAKGWGWESLR